MKKQIVLDPEAEMAVVGGTERALRWWYDRRPATSCDFSVDSGRPAGLPDGRETQRKREHCSLMGQTFTRLRTGIPCRSGAAAVISI